MPRRLIGTLLGLMLLVAGVLLALYGLFAILYGGDSGGSGDTYVTIAGHEMDADCSVVSGFPHSVGPRSPIP